MMNTGGDRWYLEKLLEVSPLLQLVVGTPTDGYAARALLRRFLLDELQEGCL